MGRLEHQGTDRLRRGRVSLPGASYFITLCSRDRKPGLDRPEVATGLIAGLRELHRDGNIDLRCATIMPDNAHVLCTLGRNLTLSQTQAKFKARTKVALEVVGLTWQDNFYDHRIRQLANLEPFARYAFRNPYRKNLVSPKGVWPWWVLNRHYTPDFVRSLLDGRNPPHEWIDGRETVLDLIDRDCAVS